jgi:hypothetical protein
MIQLLYFFVIYFFTLIPIQINSTSDNVKHEDPQAVHIAALEYKKLVLILCTNDTIPDAFCAY